ncbi:ABC transporter ATP-binding protein [Actinopolyspora erythraea]|uniref:ABC transporter ATP-binding protein n=1 Tax=Actinopolyspora erythraea TaxID=414996 RepID=A0A099D327_9ACTN|nr:ABC transporter ATP-binding protein [Actinopolyspora erythraea]ASU77610.1 ABC transporter ATP-binding protein [Actinopolyspora erythraea]KGI80553.1 ABC transporter ATP-binding protein [Actinopolyspora erythraea]
MVLLRASGLSKTYGQGRLRVEALRGVSLSVEPGEAVALMGPSGCGKSTLLNLLGLTLPVTSGELVVGGEPAPTRERERARLRNEFFGYLHQEFAIVESDTVAANVTIPLEYARPRVGRRQRLERARRVVESVGLGWALRRRAAELSGGERQRVAIARALVNEPSLVIADEPTAALDLATAGEIVTLLLSMRQLGASVLVATHDPRVAERCDRVVGMADGRLVAEETGISTD